MRVLMVSENRCRNNLVPFPLGAASVAASLEQAGHEVAGLDLMFSASPENDIEEAIRSFDPECIGLSIRNIDDQDMRQPTFFLEELLPVIGALRRLSAAPIIAGGSGFSIFPLECLEYLGLEHGITGEGEAAFCAFLKAMEAGGDPSELPGVASLKAGRGTLVPPAPPLDLASLPLPDRDVFDVRPYSWRPGAEVQFLANLQGRRGCHMRCIYCPNPIIEGCRQRMRPPAQVAAELELLETRYGLPAALFVDALFNHPLDYCEELLAHIAAHRQAIRWVCSLNPHFFRPGLAERMAQAGCAGVSIGNESGSDEILRSLRKDFTRAEIKRLAGEIKASGIRSTFFLLLGGPDETSETVRRSIELLDLLQPEQVTVTVGIRIYPGCELERIATGRGLIEPGRNLLQPAFYLEPALADWLMGFMEETCAARPGWSM